MNIQPLFAAERTKSSRESGKTVLWNKPVLPFSITLSRENKEL
jgi:hypothetical protein